MTTHPSTDLYFLAAFERAVARRWQVWRKAPIRRLGANSFVCGDWMVLIRRDSKRVMREALAWPGRLAYVMDDDVAGAATCERLPQAYRTRLAAFDRDFHRPLAERAEVLLVPSDTLADAYRGARGIRAAIRRIEPVWREALADQSHYTPLEQGGTLRVVHLGSGSHAAALAEIAPAVTEWLERDARAHFTYVAARPVLPGLEHHPRARRLEPKPWAEYRRWLARQRFHLALYPLLPTRFDRARSSSKLVEHAIAGAVGVYPEDWSPAQALCGTNDNSKDRGALLAPSEPDRWGEVLARAAAARHELGALAACAARTLAGRDACALQQALWSEILDIELA